MRMGQIRVQGGPKQDACPVNSNGFVQAGTKCTLHAGVYDVLLGIATGDG